jgi:hypothetical protein
VDLDVYNGTFLQMLQQYSPNYSNGDYDNNGTVDATDYVLWRKTMGQSVNPGVKADGDANGIVDAGDYTTWKTSFGKAVSNVPAGAGAGFASVPEPTSLFLLITGALTLTSRRTCGIRGKVARKNAKRERPNKDFPQSGPQCARA